jgi:putative redox protein
MGSGTVRVKWTGERQFIGTDSGNHSVVLSSHRDDGHTGMKPSDLLLVALASCSAYDVVDILEKKRVALEQLEVEVTRVQDEDPPWTYRKIHLDYYLKGSDLTEKGIEQAIRLSLDKYCSVAATVSGKAEITHSFHITE